VGDDELLLEARPSWWNYFWHLFCFFLVIPPLVALIERHGMVLRVYPERVVVVRGLLSRQEKEVFCGDIRTINVSQSLFQRIMRIGDLQIASAGTGGYEIDAYGLPNPRGIKDLILENKRQSSRTED
jgi:uncharacterized membrane protein YdbT with pleckstrin-like domain